MAIEVIESEVAQFNRLVMKRLQKAIEADLEVDLASKLPTSYSLRLADRKKENKVSGASMQISRSPWAAADRERR